MKNNSRDKIHAFRFGIVEDPNGDRYVIRTQDDYDRDIAAGLDEAETLRPGRYPIVKGREIMKPHAVTISVQIELDTDLLNHFKSQVSGDESLEELIVAKLRLLMEIENGSLNLEVDERKAA